jgi:hypothetical protein
MPIFACTAQCRHCGTLSGPQANGRLPLPLQLAAIRQASAMGYEEVVFSGGEPTLAGDELLIAMRAVAALGLRLRLVTNSHWATTPETARQLAAAFAGAGLHHATLSTGDEHARFVPIDRVLNAARALLEYGIGASIIVESTAAGRLNAATVSALMKFQEIVRDFPDACIEVKDAIWSALSPNRSLGYPAGVAANLANLQERGGCDELFRITTIQADGTISPCCGLGIRTTRDLRLGHIADVSLAEADHLARANPLIRWVAAEGPERVLAAAALRDETVAWQDRYAHRCQACVRVLRDRQARRAAEDCLPEKQTQIAFLETLLTPAVPN